MRSKRNLLHSLRAIDPRDELRLLKTKASYLKQLTLAFLAAVETVEPDRHLDIEHGLSLREEVRRFEIDLIKYALQRTGGNQNACSGPAKREGNHAELQDKTLSPPD